ncbi:MAG: hypothetical protein RMJ56_14660, partial [Gemmataceae bacterium]|nr:hypothetical protein [Gemmata sp.]MDW8198836.1 hypothetical protein [Gemmataceae bacterium]
MENKFLDQRRAVTQLRQSGDLPGIRKLLLDKPDFLADPECQADLMIGAAMHYHGPQLVALLHELGIPLDIPDCRNPIQ